MKAMMPTYSSPKAMPTPIKIATVAPVDAPDEIPKIYGSASGFLTMACIMTPLTASPAPTKAAKITRGIRNIHTISFKAPCRGSSIVMVLTNFDATTCHNVCAGIWTVPKNRDHAIPAINRAMSIIPTPTTVNVCVRLLMNTSCKIRIQSVNHKIQSIMDSCTCAIHHK